MMKSVVSWLRENLCIAPPLFDGYSEIVFAGVLLLIILYAFFTLIRKRSFSPILILSLVASLFMFLLAFCAPHYFVANDADWTSNKGSNTGMTIDGLMSPFIAIGAAILTFIAFWVQHRANQEMLRNNSKQQIERQFYELLKIHREMVDCLEWGYLDSEKENPANYNIVGHGGSFICSIKGFVKDLSIYRYKGQDAVRILLKELYFIYDCMDALIKNIDVERKKKYAYIIFFEGLENARYEIDDEKVKRVLDVFETIQCVVNKGNGRFRDTDLFKKYKFRRCNVFQGHRSVLNPYYRHLFLMVKTIVAAKYFTNEEKMSYLKILRAQMTGEEQMLLYYNWLSGYGSEWEEKSGNRFFTRYKMIHNIERDDWILREGNFFEKFPWMSEKEGLHLFEWYERLMKFQNKYEKKKKREKWRKIICEKVICPIVCKLSFVISGQESSQEDNQ